MRVNAAAFVSQSVPGTMVANQASAVSVTMRNTAGWDTWNVGAYYLASDNPQDNTAFGLNRVELPGPVGPGQSVTFSFNALPASGGTKNFQWRIVDSIEGAFGTASTNVAVAVSGTDSSQYVSQSVPGTMAAGQSYAVSVTLANNGNTTWSAADGFKLAPHPLPDNTTWGITRVNLPGPVAPGQQVTIPFNVTAPTLTGVYSFQWRMIHESVGTFGAASANVGYPIGTLSTEVLFVHVDHLNTPRLVADDQSRTVWRWDQVEPFGSNVPDEDPSGLGAFVMNLRFPGQYFDQETGLAYNYFRDYDANIGRYVQSDPIGLRGGLNTFAYVGSRPLTLVDPLGLETCVLVTRGALGIGTHSALYISRGSDSGGAVLYDPSGSYSRINNPGGGDMVFDKAADPKKFAEFHLKHDRDTTEMACKPTTEEEERRLFERALQEGPKTGFACSIAVSNVLSGSPYFPNVKADTFWPGNLFRGTK